jgi:hypothetical protein
MKDVIEVILKQVQGEIVLVYEDNIPDTHFSKLMSRFVSSQWRDNGEHNYWPALSLRKGSCYFRPVVLLFSYKNLHLVTKPLNFCIPTPTNLF